VWIEGQNSRPPAVLVRNRPDAFHDLLMPFVDAVKISDSDRAGAEIGRNIGKTAVDHCAAAPT
jgi:hypothetical protein